MTDLRKAEPVAWMSQAGNFLSPLEFTTADAALYGWTPVYTTQPPLQRKPLSDFDARGILAATLTFWHRLKEAEAAELVKLFIDHVAPEQRKPLTDQEIEATFLTCNGRWDGDRWVIEDADFHPFARAIEQAHGIKETP